ncbi:MAG: (2Fe-2S)-binding protein [Desulfobacterales bacterium]|nr:(2Fe-2S)-binding protein [Desulfobacterales bacterium]
MFKSESKKDLVEVSLDGRSVSLPAGVSVAAALLEAGEIISRISPTSAKPCSPHCLMGVCFECMMEIDGVQRQACMTQVKSGMSINRCLEEENVHEPS